MLRAFTLSVAQLGDPFVSRSRINRRRLILVAALAFAGCQQNAPPRSAGASPPPSMKEAGLGRVVGRTAAQMVQLFGPADLDAHEGRARRLQFVGAACVLDAYLYPPENGGQPVVSYLDARTPQGEDIDRASCVAALSRRQQAP
jgi:hypothetical protein